MGPENELHDTDLFDLMQKIKGSEAPDVEKLAWAFDHITGSIVEHAGHEIEVARRCASVVFPTPGTSSMSRWPPASRPITVNFTVSCLPTKTLTGLLASTLESRYIFRADKATWCVLHPECRT